MTMSLCRVFSNVPLLSIIGLPLLAFGVCRISKYATMSSCKIIAPSSAPSWDWTPKEIIADANKLVEDSTKFYDHLAQLKVPSIENLIKPFMQHESETRLLTNQLTFLQHVSEDEKLRAASVEVTEVLQNFEIELSLRHDLYLQFDKVWNEVKDRQNRYEKDSEEYEIIKYVEKCHKDFVRAGLNLSKEKREKVKNIRMSIASNSLKFSKNLGEQNEYIAFTKAELEGVSESVLEQLEKFEDEETKAEKYKVTFKYPDIFPVLKTAKLPSTRRNAFTADQNKVSQNEALLRNTLILRNELAELLGYSSYAAYNLENKMAKKEEVVFNFLEDLKNKLAPLGKTELENLKNIKKKECKELGIPYDGEYYIWDHRYYDNKYLKDNYKVDFEKISEYYPLEHSIKGMLDIYETLLKLKFVEETDSSKKKVWHEDVKLLSVWKMDVPASPEFVGWIYFDLHPREGKYGHAANFGISSSFINADGKRSYPLTALVCNFSKPSSQKKPSLLKHNELTTFFHELGHGIHDLVGNNRAARFNGPSSVPWDFVEAPSQMLEFWTWNKEELLALSNHYETNEKIPEELLESLISTKHVNGALAALRQLHFGLFDMEVHTCHDLDNLDLQYLWNKSREKVSLLKNGDDLTRGYDSFGHIMSDSYSAGYYGYMWAEVFAADMYHSKFAANPLDSEVGVQYRDIVLARGSLFEINDNLREFLGREPSKNAFLFELGLSKKEVKL